MAFQVIAKNKEAHKRRSSAEWQEYLRERNWAMPTSPATVNLGIVVLDTKEEVLLALETEGFSTKEWSFSITYVD